MGRRATGANVVLNAAFEDAAAYGTPPAAGTYFQLPFVSHTLGEEQALLASDLLGQGRSPLPPTLDVANNTGDIVVPVDLRNFGMWLKLMLGDPTTVGAADPYTHTWDAGAIALPSMTAEIGHPDIAVPKYGQNFGLRGSQLKVALARSGMLNATVSVIAQGENWLGAPVDADPSTLVIERFPQAVGEIRRNGAALASIVSADWTLNNDLDPVDVIRSDGRIEDADPGTVAFTGSIVTRFKDTTLLDQAVSGAPCSISFSHALGAGKSLTVTAPSVFLPKPKVSVSGPKGIQVTFNFQAAKDPGTGKTATFVLVNDVAAY